MTVFLLACGALGLGTAAVMLARASALTRSINQLLYDTEHPRGGD